jgi:hypothetical protein
VIGAVALAALAPLLASAETDQYYSWLVDVPDSADVLNAHLGRDFRARLAAVNARDDRAALSCSDVARALLAPYWTTGTWFVLGATDDWGFAYVPRTATERVERFDRASIYQMFSLLPVGGLVPVDPTIRAGDVYFGTDKISHFLHNAWRYWETYRDARARGLDVPRAEREAIARGLAQESGVLGLLVSSSFSFADLEVNYQGLRHIRSWCEDGGLVLTTDASDARARERWVLTREFDLRDWVNPCWDESFYNNAYIGPTAANARAMIATYCNVRDTPRVRTRLAHYRAHACTSASVRHLDQLVSNGTLPDPRAFNIDTICADSAARTARDAYPWPNVQTRFDDDTPHLPWSVGGGGDGRPAGACIPRSPPRRRRRPRSR